jgi:uncharacterized protein (DUF433 family)
LQTSVLPLVFEMEGFIEINPEVCNGRPIIRGTRITVDTVFCYLSAGDSVEDVIESHPRLSSDEVLACIE